MSSSAARYDRSLALICVLFVAMAASVASPSAAEIYKWADESGHTHYADGIDSVPQRYRAQATPIGLRNSPEATAVTESGVRKEPTGGTTIRYTPGDRIVIDARVNGRHGVKLLLDTGADRTLIAPRALVAAGASLTHGGIKGSITGVTGKADIQHVRIDSIEVGEARVAPLFVISYDLSQTGNDGLLGRDFLDRFDVKIDSSRGLVTFAPKK